MNLPGIPEEMKNEELKHEFVNLAPLYK